MFSINAMMNPKYNLNEKEITLSISLEIEGRTLEANFLICSSCSALKVLLLRTPESIDSAATRLNWRTSAEKAACDRREARDQQPVQ